MNHFKQEPDDRGKHSAEIEATIKSLPIPDQEAQRHSAALISLISDEIAEQGGKISFAKYMQLALTAPGLGYYSGASVKLGRGGDFTTAPEISSLFSRCIAQQCHQVLLEIEQKEARCILEFGAGTGILAADMLAELEQLGGLPTKYFILEISADLRQRQMETLQSRVPQLVERVEWLDELPKQGISGVVLANEVLDALPVHRFKICKEGVKEIFVGKQDEKFIEITADISSKKLQSRIEKDLPPLNLGYVSEVNLAADAWLRSTGELIEQGLLLIIDYGYPRQEYYHPQRTTGTLMCHYRHRVHGDAFVYPGLQDITAHIDFTSIAQVATETGLTVAGYTTQAAFLIATGITELASTEKEKSDLETLKTSQEIKTLTMPSEMGEIFKVMALSKGLSIPLLGFKMQDLRGRL